MLTMMDAVEVRAAPSLEDELQLKMFVMVVAALLLLVVLLLVLAFVVFSRSIVRLCLN